MPELPAVHYTTELIRKNCLKKEILKCQFLPQKDEIIFTEDVIQILERTKYILKVGRWGKQMWLQLDNGFVLMHLGMTGFVQISGQSRLRYESSPSNKKEMLEEWPPRFTKLLLRFADDSEMIFADARRLGRVAASTAKSETEMIAFLQSKLGFDPILSDDLKLDNFISLTQKRRVKLKSLLLDQKYVAGVGNWMADDILLEARLSPHRLGSSLDESECKALLRAIRHISQTAIDAEAQKAQFPQQWLFHIRWNHGKETLTGLPVKEERLGGRSTFWIPKLQK